MEYFNCLRFFISFEYDCNVNTTRLIVKVKRSAGNAEIYISASIDKQT